jgi:hypothetical protein
MDFWGLLMRTEEMRVALADALVAAIWLAAPYMPVRFAEQCPWYHCEEDIPLPQEVKLGQ